MMYVWLAVAIALAAWHGVFARRLRAALEHISAKLDVALAAHGDGEVRVSLSILIECKYIKKNPWVILCGDDHAATDRSIWPLMCFDARRRAV